MITHLYTPVALVNEANGRVKCRGELAMCNNKDCVPSLYPHIPMHLASDAVAWEDSRDYLEGHIVIGSDSNYYRCKLKHYSIAADNKPITGTNWATYWEARTGDGYKLGDIVYDNYGDAPNWGVYKSLIDYNHCPDPIAEPAYPITVWTQYTYYAIGSVVIGSTGKMYRCWVAHTASSTATKPTTGADWATKWIEGRAWLAISEHIPKWAAWSCLGNVVWAQTWIQYRDYEKGDVVIGNPDGKSYMCIVNHDSGERVASRPTESDETAEDWESGVYYNPYTDMVRDDYEDYVCKYYHYSTEENRPTGPNGENYWIKREDVWKIYWVDKFNKMYEPYGGPGRRPKFLNVITHDIQEGMYWEEMEEWGWPLADSGGANRKWRLRNTNWEWQAPDWYSAEWALQTAPDPKGGYLIANWQWCQNGYCLQVFATWSFQWAEGVLFRKGTLIVNKYTDQGALYECIKTHVAEASNKPPDENDEGEGAYWETYWAYKGKEGSEQEGYPYPYLWPPNINNLNMCFRDASSSFSDLCRISGEFKSEQLQSAFGGTLGYEGYMTVEDEPFGYEEEPDWESGHNYGVGDRIALPDIYMPAWVRNHSYVEDDAVILNGIRYICIKDHTSDYSNRPQSGADTATHWFRQTLDYVCIQSHTASADNRPMATNWRDYWYWDTQYYKNYSSDMLE